MAATLKPTSDSDIKVEIWLPSNGWNGKLQAVGNGGWAGTISYSAMADAVRGGYASASTDTGHVGGGGAFALGHPEKLVDFAWRSEHEMTVKSKLIIKAFYGNAPQYSYWNGCSTGGRQGYLLAQELGNQLDGILASAPAMYWTRFQTALVLRIGSVKVSSIGPLIMSIDDIDANDVRACTVGAPIFACIEAASARVFPYVNTPMSLSATPAGSHCSCARVIVMVSPSMRVTILVADTFLPSRLTEVDLMTHLLPSFFQVPSPKPP